jgi:hypothetical protein
VEFEILLPSVCFECRYYLIFRGGVSFHPLLSSMLLQQPRLIPCAFGNTPRRNKRFDGPVTASVISALRFQHPELIYWIHRIIPIHMVWNQRCTFDLKQLSFVLEMLIQLVTKTVPIIDLFDDSDKLYLISVVVCGQNLEQHPVQPTVPLPFGQANVPEDFPAWSSFWGPQERTWSNAVNPYAVCRQ